MTKSNQRLTHSAVFLQLRERFGDTFLSLKDLPPPSAFKDMDKAVARIVKAIVQKESIVLVGDYDVDGVVSTSVMKLFFDALGKPLEWIIPNRFRDGYGLSTTLIPKIQHADLVITVDNGISAVEAAKSCQELGIDLIITDHHIVPEVVPQAYAIINQKQVDCTYPHQEICGAQIAWYLCNALNHALESRIAMKPYLELVSIAIIADIMPLIHINRAMVQAGLKLLNRSQRPCIKAFMEQRNQEIWKSEDIAFGLAPLLNSAGRLEDASLSVAFICSDTVNEAKKSLETLQSLNEQRKSLEQEITDEAAQKVDRASKVILVASEGWHEGVVGIVAARLARRFEKPAIVLSQDAEICKGSGRSFHRCDLFSLVDTQRSVLEKFGGHSAAVGLSIKRENLSLFGRALERYAQEYCSHEVFEDPDILGELPFGEIDFSLLGLIAQFEPFGEANAQPKFFTDAVEILAVQQMGKEKNHLRFTFGSEDVIQHGVQFKTLEMYNVGEKVNIVYTLNENHFRGETHIQLMVEKVTRRS